jgi:hypothetical protein
MRAFRAIRFAAVWGALGVGLGRPSLAETQACAAMVVEADDDVRARFPELHEHVLGTFATRDGIDTCAKVELSMIPPVIVVEVTLADGRSALRTVGHREDVVPVLEALLVLPRDDARAADVESIEASKAPPTSENRARPQQLPAPRDELDESRADAGDRRGIEFSVVTGARAGDGQYSVNLGLLSFLELAGFLAGLEGRVDSYTAANAVPYETFEAMALFGRRFHFNAADLDFVAGPAVVLQGTSTVVESGPATSTGESGAAVERTESTSGVVPRLVLGTHLGFPARSVLRTFVGVEGEVGPPANARGDERLRPPRLPVWMVGIALGATVGTR